MPSPRLQGVRGAGDTTVGDRRRLRSEGVRASHLAARCRRRRPRRVGTPHDPAPNTRSCFGHQPAGKCGSTSRAALAHAQTSRLTSQPATSRLVVTGVSVERVSSRSGGFIVGFPIINPASTNANRAEKAALRVAFDAPLSTIARWTASMIALQAWREKIMRPSFIRASRAGDPRPLSRGRDARTASRSRPRDGEVCRACVLLRLPEPGVEEAPRGGS
jgi:hypothetical protein